MNQTRREFLESCAVAAGALATLGSPAVGAEEGKKTLYDISLAEWSIHNAIFKKKMEHLDFAKFAKESCGIHAVEYVNQFFFDKATNADYLNEMSKRATDLGVKQLLIMIDGEGMLGDPDDAKRTQAIEKHHKWVEAAKALGCHSIRVNAASRGSFEEQMKLATDGLSRLTEFADKLGINVIVENHGGLSSNGKWLSGVLKAVNNPRCGSLPDFGNFRVSITENYDRYQGVAELMPFAKAVSAKSHDFDDAGNEIHTDYYKMMKIVVDAGYHGFVGIEYEGSKLPEPEGILATKMLLETVRDKLAS